MKKNVLFEKCLANVSPEVSHETNLNIDIANRIYDVLKEKKITQKEFARMLGKKEPEISRWLSGKHGFTIATIAKISAVLKEPVIQVPKKEQEIHEKEYYVVSIKESVSFMTYGSRYTSPLSCEKGFEINYN